MSSMSSQEQIEGLTSRNHDLWIENESLKKRVAFLEFQFCTPVKSKPYTPSISDKQIRGGLVGDSATNIHTARVDQIMGLDIREGPVFAVQTGRKVGFFLTWKECEDQVLQFKGNKHKRFKKISDAYVWMGLDMPPAASPVVKRSLKRRILDQASTDEVVESEQ